MFRLQILKINPVFGTMEQYMKSNDNRSDNLQSADPGNLWKQIAGEKEGKQRQEKQ